MIDLHSHTTASDGTFTPAELVMAAGDAGLEALAITDHDTFAGYDLAAPLAKDAGLQLICGIELSTKLDSNGSRRTVHLLGYFIDQAPTESFRGWLKQLHASRRDRNRRLALKLQGMGMDIRLEEVEALGRTMAGRPHFARLMVSKGYVPHYRAAFDLYLDESASAYVDREEPALEDGIRLIRDAGGMSSLAHPVRLGLTNAEQEEDLIAGMARRGLDAIEAYHSDHDASDTRRYLSLASKHGLRVTGGSDFHGDNKPNVRLGQGPGTLDIPVSVLAALRSSRAQDQADQ
jgi:predicted metal-dependent phosphoesterase TrpH